MYKNRIIVSMQTNNISLYYILSYINKLTYVQNLKRNFCVLLQLHKYIH